jgi:hypothetical protein
MDKTCSRCGEVKPPTEYHNKTRRDGTPGKVARCRSCECELKKLRYDPVKHRDRTIRTKFGITSADYDEILKSQGNECAICGTTEFKYSRGRRPHIDHCHETGKVRGLLCGHCNLGIGQFFDNVSLLERAITYLKEHGSVSRTCPDPNGML